MPSRKTSSARGNAFQNEIEKFFLENGFAVHNQKPSSKRIFTPKGPIFVSARNDIFGAFDLIALFDNRRTKYVQATLHTGIGEKKKQIDKLPWNPLYSTYEIWQKIPRKGVRILVKVDIPDKWADLGMYNLLKDEDEARRYFMNM